MKLPPKRRPVEFFNIDISPVRLSEVRTPPLTLDLLRQAVQKLSYQPSVTYVNPAFYDELVLELSWK